MQTIGFIGVGTMGKGMVENLAKNGFSVLAYNRTKSRIESLASDKITIVDNPQGVTTADVIFTCLPSDESLQEIFETIQTHLAGKTFIDCGTTSIELTQKITDLATNFDFIDAPITGSKLGAEGGKLMFMVGGKKDLVEKYTPILNAMGQRIVYCGENTFGQRAKIALNLTQALILQSYFEGITLAVKEGVPLDAIHEILDNSGAHNKACAFKIPYIKKRDFDQHFMLKLMYKDLKLAEKEQQRLGLTLPLTNNIVEVFKKAMDRGEGDDDFCTIIKTLEKMADIEIK
ncbi:NAD(P)-dependent oxidoreductase [archaeon]|jgi:3-hydroxyisobutyrate dehydrogenase|nr:NAD(P)-dependent oxidoreductase [archaeon]MBT6698656.1 NAD(P)-dependent oxidoreductase [archaeon]